MWQKGMEKGKKERKKEKEARKGTEWKSSPT
jgi:hypothetical protein